MVAAGTTGELHSRHRDGKALSTIDCLEFLLSLPAEPILVGYGFGYDTNQILRGIGKIPTLRRILDPPQGRNGPVYIYWQNFAICYQPHQYFRVARVDRSGPKPSIVKGSVRTVNETLGFFQCKFSKAMRNWNIGSDDERALIDKNKDLREQFSELTEEIAAYCELECRLLAMLMTDFREVCTLAGILPKQWRGAGSLAAALLEKHSIPKRPLSAKEIVAAAERTPGKNPKPAVLRRPQRNREFEVAANLGFCGGRFETSRIGLIPGPIYQYDLHSAYPAQMPELPCPVHTRWQHRPRAARLPEGELYLAKISVTHPQDSLWCGLPFRRRGGLSWPLQGTGWYWSPEIEAAQGRLGAEVAVVHDLWIARRQCDCRLYDWVPDLYEKRRQLGFSTRGYPLKFGLASLYGKHAQRCGRALYHDAVAAGLITARTRACLIGAAGHDPGAVVMLATDAVFSTRPLPLDCGAGLGQWEEKVWPDLFIAQPGVYWSPTEVKASAGLAESDSLKSRGAPRSVIRKAAPLFEQRFNDWVMELRQPGGIERMLQERQRIPSVPVTIRVFYGCRLTLARGKPWLAGKWADDKRYDSFEWRSKRDPMRVKLNDDGSLATFPPLNSIFAESEGYEPEEFATEDDIKLEAMPDYIPFLPHEE
jgi:hypothetical protein